MPTRLNRVLRQGGKVAILEFSEPHEGPLAPLARAFVKHIVPRVGALLSGGARDEYVHLQRSISKFPFPKDFAEEVSTAGFADVRWELVHPGGVYLYTATAAPARAST